MQTKQVAAAIVSGLASNEAIRFVATYGYKFEQGIPYGITAEQRFELLNEVQDRAKALEATL